MFWRHVRPRTGGGTKLFGSVVEDLGRGPFAVTGPVRMDACGAAVIGADEAAALSGLKLKATATVSWDHALTDDQSADSVTASLADALTKAT